MPTNFAVRLAFAWNVVRDVVESLWAPKCDKLVAYEHNTDGAERVHCHLLLMGCSVGAEQLKTLARNCAALSTAKGNSAWSFKTKAKGLGLITEESSERYIIYMTKGKYDPQHNKGYDPAFLQTCKTKWVQSGPKDDRSITYNEFELIMLCKLAEQHGGYEFFPTDTVIRTYIGKAYLKREANSFAYKHYGRIWFVGTANMAKMLYDTFCMRHEIYLD